MDLLDDFYPMELSVMQYGFSACTIVVYGDSLYPVDEELCPNGTTEVLCDGLQIAFMIGNVCADI